MSGYGFDAVYEKPVTICHRQSLVNPPSDTHTSPHCLLKHDLPSGYGARPSSTQHERVYAQLIMYVACSKIDNVSRHTEQLKFV